MQEKNTNIPDEKKPGEDAPLPGEAGKQGGQSVGKKGGHGDLGKGGHGEVGKGGKTGEVGKPGE